MWRDMEFQRIQVHLFSYAYLIRRVMVFVDTWNLNLDGRKCMGIYGNEMESNGFSENWVI